MFEMIGFNWQNDYNTDHSWVNFLEDLSSANYSWP